MNMIVRGTDLHRASMLAGVAPASADLPTLAPAMGEILDQSADRCADADLFALGEVWAASWGRCMAADAVPGDDDEAEQERDNAHAENCGLRARIMAKPARTLDGLKLKARIAATLLAASEPEDAPLDILAAHVAREHRGCVSAEAMAPNVLRDLLMMLDEAAIVV